MVIDKAGGTVLDSDSGFGQVSAQLRCQPAGNSLRVILLNTKQELIKVVSVSQGTLNEALAQPRKCLTGRTLYPPDNRIVASTHGEPQKMIALGQMPWSQASALAIDDLLPPDPASKSSNPA